MDEPLIAKLSGGDRRSIGRVPEVVEQVLHEPNLFDELFELIFVEDPLVQMRAADAAVKVARERPELLQLHKKSIIKEIPKIDQQEVQWAAAEMYGLLKLTKKECAIIYELLVKNLQHKSSILRTFSMQALVDICRYDPSLMKQVRPIIEDLAKTGTPAMRARGRMLMKRIAKTQ